MAYQVSILPSALREMAVLARPDQRRIRNKIDGLTIDPRPPDAKRLRGRRDFFRLRSGHYRIIYTVDDDRLSVLIIKIGHRREVYRRL